LPFLVEQPELQTAGSGGILLSHIFFRLFSGFC
jgi:hypothetical protein